MTQSDTKNLVLRICYGCWHDAQTLRFMLREHGVRVGGPGLYVLMNALEDAGLVIAADHDWVLMGAPLKRRMWKSKSAAFCAVAHNSVRRPSGYWPRPER